MEAALNGPSGRTTLGPTEVTIGRLPGNQLVVNDAKASSRHAEIRPAGQGYTITDLGSTNGTFVNEQRLPPNVPYSLNPGDRVRIGDTTFTYEVTGAAIAPTVYGGPSQGNSPGYNPTVAAGSPYANNPPGYLPTEAAPSAYTDYNQGSPGAAAYQAQGYQSPAYQSPPPPAYPPYGDPAQPAYAPPGPVAQPARRGNRTLWIILGIVGGVLILGIIGCVALVAAFASTPTKTLDTFCNALKSKDFQTAYSQLSSFRQTKISESQFANAFTPANSCTHSTPTESGTTATATLTFFTNSGTVDAPTNLVQENGTWKIDSINIPSQSP